MAYGSMIPTPAEVEFARGEMAAGRGMWFEAVPAGGYLHNTLWYHDGKLGWFTHRDALDDLCRSDFLLHNMIVVRGRGYRNIPSPRGVFHAGLEMEEGL